MQRALSKKQTLRAGVPWRGPNHGMDADMFSAAEHTQEGGLGGAPPPLPEGKYFRMLARAVPPQSVIPGKSVEEPIATEFTAQQLRELNPIGLGLKINHSARPLKAVLAEAAAHFFGRRWGASTATTTCTSDAWWTGTSRRSTG